MVLRWRERAEEASLKRTSDLILILKVAGTFSIKPAIIKAHMRSVILIIEINLLSQGIIFQPRNLWDINVL